MEIKGEREVTCAVYPVAHLPGFTWLAQVLCSPARGPAHLAFCQSSPSSCQEDDAVSPAHAPEVSTSCFVPAASPSSLSVPRDA